MDEAAIRAVIQQAQSVDPQLRDRWIADSILAAVQPTTGVVMSANVQTPKLEIAAGYVEPGGS
jgi:hypothetical protein